MTASPPLAQVGRVEAGFQAALGRFAGPVRGVGVLSISAFGVLGVPADALPLGVALLALMLVGAVADLGPRRWALVAAVARVVAVCAAQGWLGDADQWALNVLTTTAITLQWEWSPKVTVPVTAGLVAVALVGSGFHDVPTTVARVVVECSLAWLAFALLRRSSRQVDELQAGRAALERAEAVAVATRRREREYLALLHDTAAATFLAVAVRDTDPDEVAGYARRDLAVLTGGSGVPGDTPVDLASSLRPVLDRVPLRVDAVWATALVPTSVALALVRAVREALRNVRRHAGVSTARVEVAAGDGVVVTVSDTGVGFDPDAVPDHRRGVRGSIVERMAAVGGHAEVTSRPGGGTTVRLVWRG
ncbi:ATP-binding protein [Actinosynnema sp. NPDC020468]|uniref:sensor histidine kinase n=1 Tax=Actinosynnema sp. NPDC020468 TaxID=3154488 RepID=UPI0033E6C594